VPISIRTPPYRTTFIADRPILICIFLLTLHGLVVRDGRRRKHVSLLNLLERGAWGRRGTAAALGSASDKVVGADALGHVVVVKGQRRHTLHAQALLGVGAATRGLDETAVTAVATNLAALAFLRSHSAANRLGSNGDAAGVTDAKAVSAVDATNHQILKIASVIATAARHNHAMAGALFRVACAR